MGTAAAVISAALGTGELVLLALALSHVIDPGWPAFETIGTIAGVGTSVGVAIVARSTRSRFPGILDVLSVAAFLAALVGTGAWLTLFGAPFFTVDFVRAALLVAADIVVALWFLVAALTVTSSRPWGLSAVAILLAVRSVLEIWLFGPLLMRPAGVPSGGPSSGIEGILIGLLVVSGYVFLAAWEIALAAWVVSRDRATR